MSSYNIIIASLKEDRKEEKSQFLTVSGSSGDYKGGLRGHRVPLLNF